MQSIATATLVLRRFVAPALSVLALCACAQAGPVAFDEFRPYEAEADARAEIAARIADNPEQKRILLTFGANWCSDSRALESHYRSAELGELLEREFLIVHIDVGTFHRNLDVIASYGDPTDKGIPSVVLLAPDGSPLFVNHGQLSSAETMSSARIMEFFTRLAADSRVD